MTGASNDRTPNVALRAARVRAALSQDELARALREAGWKSCDRRTVQRYESGEVRRPQFVARRSLVEVLGVPWAELGFEPNIDSVHRVSPPQGPDMPGRPRPSHLEGADDVRRRTFALGVAMAGLGTGLADSNAFAAEAVRHSLQSAAGGPSAEASEWEAIRDEYALRMPATPPALLLGSLLTDLQQLNLALAGRDPESVAGLHRAGAALAGIAAWTYGNLGDTTSSGRWWRTAHGLARASSDRHTQLWVTAQEAVMGLYGGTPAVRLALAKVTSAESLAEELPGTTGAAWLYCAQAQALGMAGEATAAEQALQRLQDTFAALDPSVTSDRSSFLGWAETRLHFTGSFTYSHLGNYEAASAAQDQALGSFPVSVVRDPVKVELQRALCMARMGAVDDAEHHAVVQLSRLEHGMHDLPIANLAARVVHALPASRSSDEGEQLADYVRTGQLSIAGTT